MKFVENVCADIVPQREEHEAEQLDLKENS